MDGLEPDGEVGLSQDECQSQGLYLVEIGSFEDEPTEKTTQPVVDALHRVPWLLVVVVGWGGLWC